MPVCQHRITMEVTHEGGFLQGFVSSPDTENSFLELVIYCVDNESFYHRFIYLCVHNTAELNQNHQLEARGGHKQLLCGLQAPEQQRLRAGVSPRAAATG